MKMFDISLSFQNLDHLTYISHLPFHGQTVRQLSLLRFFKT